MGDVLRFTNAKWDRLDPIYPAPWEINCIIVQNFLGQEVPRSTDLSVFENKWINHLRGHRHREVYDYLNADSDRRGYQLVMKLYGTYIPMENARFSRA